MGIFEEVEDIYYNKEKYANLFISSSKIQAVSLYLDRNIGSELLDIVEMDAVDKSDYEEKILKLITMKQDVLKSLVEIRNKYKKLYYRVKSGKKLTDEELVCLEEIKSFKRAFVSYVRFLDGALHVEHRALNNLMRKNKRYNDVDMKTSIILDDDSKFVYDMMIDHEDFYETDNHVYLQALSYYVKSVDFSKLSDDERNICMGYVDEVLDRLKVSASLYLENIEDVNLLKQVVLQRRRSLPKEDKLNRYFLGAIGKRVTLLEDRLSGYGDSLEIDDDDAEICSAFYKAINDEKNINVISSFLDKRPDLIYMVSPNNQTQYYLGDIISMYGNLLLNSRENHNDFEYYRLLLNKYVDVINTLDNQDMKVFVLRKLQKVIKTITASDFSIRRKEACLFSVEECINKLNGKDESRLLEFHNVDSANYFSYHKASCESVFTIDDDTTKKYEQAYSFREENGIKYLSFYIPDTTELYGDKMPAIEELVATSSEKNGVLASFISKSLSLKKGNSRDVIGYHFAIDSDYQVKNLDIRKEKINVSNNFTFSDVETIIDDDNYYANNMRKMIDTLENIDGIDSVVKKEKIGKYLTTKLSLFFQTSLGKYCDSRDIPYISRFVYTKSQKEDGIVREIDENLNNRNLTVGQIIKSVENAYLTGIYTTSTEEHMGSDRRAKVTAPFRQLSSFINQIVIYHYFINGDDISYREDLKTRRDLRKITDCLNKKLIEDEMEETYKEEQQLKSKIKQVNKNVSYRQRKASEN